MAERATGDRIASDMQPPNYRGAVKTIRTVDAKKKKIAELNGDIGTIWGKMEGYRVHKRAAKFWDMLDKLEPQERADVLRSLNGLVDASDWEDTTDLVDQAEGVVNNVVPLGNRKGEQADGEKLADKPKRISPAEARARAQAHFTPSEPKSEGDGEAGAAGSGEPNEPFTGDNSDLAGE